MIWHDDEQDRLHDKLVEEAGDTAEPERRCPACDARLAPDATHCPQCERDQARSRQQGW